MTVSIGAVLLGILAALCTVYTSFFPALFNQNLLLLILMLICQLVRTPTDAGILSFFFSLVSSLFFLLTVFLLCSSTEQIRFLFLFIYILGTPLLSLFLFTIHREGSFFEFLGVLVLLFSILITYLLRASITPYDLIYLILFYLLLQKR